MKQLIQDLKSGQTLLEEIPAPQVNVNYISVFMLNMLQKQEKSK